MPPKLQRKICVFGCYDDSELYPRNRQLIEALKTTASELVEVRPTKRAKRQSNQVRVSSLMGVATAALDALQSFFSLAGKFSMLRGADIYFVPYPAYLDLFFLAILTLPLRRRPVIVDAFLCLHDTLVDDRKMVAAGSLLSRLVSLLERSTLCGADLVLIDTQQQKNLLVLRYGLKPERVIVTPVGIDESVWTPLPVLPLKDQFTVLFWGTFIPLHGVNTIIDAAVLLQRSHPHIRLVLIGDGQTAPEAERQIRQAGVENIVWKRHFLAARELRSELAKAHCVLGIFGSSEKAGNVIPYKVYQALASNKMLITRAGPAIAGLLDNEMEPSGLVLVAAGDPDALASEICQLVDSYEEISPSVGLRSVYDRDMSNRVLSERLAAAVATL